MSVLTRLPVVRMPHLPPRQQVDPYRFCEKDQWRFDAAATDGKCPICGWRPPGDAIPQPDLVRLYHWIDWDTVGIVALAVVLTVIAAWAIHAANFRWSDLNPAAP